MTLKKYLKIFSYNFSYRFSICDINYNFCLVDRCDIYSFHKISKLNSLKKK